MRVAATAKGKRTGPRGRHCVDTDSTRIQSQNGGEDDLNMHRRACGKPNIVRGPTRPQARELPDNGSRRPEFRAVWHGPHGGESPMGKGQDTGKGASRRPADRIVVNHGCKYKVKRHLRLPGRKHKEAVCPPHKRCAWPGTEYSEAGAVPVRKLGTGLDNS